MMNGDTVPVGLSDTDIQTIMNRVDSIGGTAMRDAIDLALFRTEKAAARTSSS